MTSWSSKIIADGTVESSQRIGGSLHASWYRRVYSSKSEIVSPGGSLVSRRRADELERVGRHLVGVDLVAEQEHGVRPLGRDPSPPSGTRSRAGRRPRGRSRARRAATCTAARADRPCGRSRRRSRAGPRAACVRSALGGNSLPGSGHTRVAVERAPRTAWRRSRAGRSRARSRSGGPRPRTCARSPPRRRPAPRPRTAASVSTHTVASSVLAQRCMGPRTRPAIRRRPRARSGGGCRTAWCARRPGGRRRARPRPGPLGRA